MRSQSAGEKVIRLVPVLFLLLLALYMFGAFSMARYGVASRVGDPRTFVRADGVGVYETGNDYGELSRGLFMNDAPDPCDFTSVTVSHLNKPYLYLFGTLWNANGITVLLNGERIMQGINVSNKRFRHVWEDIYLDKYFGVHLPPSMCRYGTNEIVIVAGDRVERYYLEVN